MGYGNDSAPRQSPQTKKCRRSRARSEGGVRNAITKLQTLLPRSACHGVVRRGHRRWNDTGPGPPLVLPERAQSYESWHVFAIMQMT